MKDLQQRIDSSQINDELVEQVVVYEAELLRKNKQIGQLIGICKTFINEIKTHQFNDLE